MKRKFFGSESILQRQFIASGLTGVFALSAVGSSYAGAMEEEDLIIEQVIGADNQKDPDTGCFFNKIKCCFKKHKVAVVVIIVFIVLAIIVVVLLPTVILPAVRSQETNTEEQKEQGKAKTGESSVDDQKINEDQKPIIDDQGKKDINKKLLVGGIVAGSGTVLTVGGIAAKNMMDNKKKEETSIEGTVVGSENEDGKVDILDADLSDGTEKGDNLEENETDVENKGTGKVGE